ncbi:putative tetratricopeptide repeat protein 1 (TTC1) [Aspergillus clavatus NRRL 1]|uniref:Tetratricopeptide repeat protein 1 (TTC1), putative n=1 Tax=Aspergillus clavatus (strain ATCC 1007 / CBS 513.65 / DSM 816 / NCTC 3887 / NRRL 1 / QM 1276 / 107) TaxID=344612 RepID=A1CTW8_ASPCL|nr:tetratricopeptide repeat protein 1 (TTC1), putative [Aspergillus clavatus NRRL 1]EAW06755.1 tetratricopeptide repeat protein 1 (TTC1), putative [Aspergillus clavatus NRRL 1]
MTQEPSKDNSQHGAADSDSEGEDVFHDARFPADEEANLLKESHEIKSEANKLFAAACYDQAISSYDRALASCPNYLDYEVAVLRSNMAACYLKLEDWRASVDSATACLDRLNNIIPLSPQDQKETKDKQSEPEDQTDAVVEISGEDEEAEEEELKRLQRMDEQRNDVMRIRAKALMRRARAKSQLGGWGNLQGAEEDYKLLAGMDNLPPDDRRVVQKALRELPGRIKQAREKEMADMMGKLKDLGNGILKPFGLSTNNFNFVQDPKMGGYSMNFQSGS